MQRIKRRKHKQWNGDTVCIKKPLKKHKHNTHMVFVECVDHSGIDVADGDAQDNNDYIPAESCKEGVQVLHGSCHISVHWCEIHVSSWWTGFKKEKT